jgi:hypothetical protein
MRAHSQVLDYKIGDRVTFQPEGRPPVVGMLTRYKRKTVTVITDSVQHWNVAPGFLRKAAPIETTETSSKGNPAAKGINFCYARVSREMQNRESDRPVAFGGHTEAFGGYR